VTALASNARFDLAKETVHARGAAEEKVYKEAVRQ
jgi:hypothetical protein